MIKVPYIDLKGQHAALKKEIPVFRKDGIRFVHLASLLHRKP